MPYLLNVNTNENPCGIMDNDLIGDFQRWVGNGDRERCTTGLVEKIPDDLKCNEGIRRNR
jgi:hypothetical protein